MHAKAIRHDSHHDPLSVLIEAGMKAELLSASDEAFLAREVRSGSQQAFERLLRAHLRLVLSVAYSLRRYGLPVEDLVSEGLVGLVESARRFDPDRGVRFAAYAMKSIRLSLRRYAFAHRRIVRPPSSRDGRKALANLRRAQHALVHSSGADADRHAVAALLEVDVRVVEEIEAALSGGDIPYGRELAGAGVELACDAASAEALLSAAEERASSERSLNRALSELSARERLILEFHSGPDKVSLAAIAREIGVSRERVRQLEERALEKVRNSMAHA